jgi:hypothetical protein
MEIGELAKVVAEAVMEWLVWDGVQRRTNGGEMVKVISEALDKALPVEAGKE